MKNTHKRKYVLKSKKRFIIIVSIVVLLALTLGAVAWGYNYIRSIADNISTQPGANANGQPGVTVTPIERPAPDERVNVLVMGIAKGMSDTIMLCSYYPKVGAIDIISIPRDTYVKRVATYDSAYNKINSNYGQGGAEHVVQVVKDFSKVNVNYYVEVNYEAVEGIIDAMGGLNIEVQNDMNYDDPADDLHIHFKKGTIVSKGSDIIRVLRWRKNNHNAGGYNEGDIGRIKFQQSVVKQALEKVISGNPIATLIKIKKPLEEHVRTNMSPDDIMYYVGLATKINKDKITMQTIPGIGTMVGRLSFFVPYPNTTQALFDILRNNQEMPQPLPTSVKITEKLNIPVGPKPTGKATPTPTVEPGEEVGSATPEPTVEPTAEPTEEPKPTESQADPTPEPTEGSDTIIVPTNP